MIGCSSSIMHDISINDAISDIGKPIDLKIYSNILCILYFAQRFACVRGLLVRSNRVHTLLGDVSGQQKSLSSTMLIISCIPRPFAGTARCLSRTNISTITTSCDHFFTIVVGISCLEFQSDFSTFHKSKTINIHSRLIDILVIISHF